MGAKSQTSVSSGGIGVTQEIGEIGGVKVTGGVSVELSPIGINISGNPDYEDPSKSTISISGGAEAPGGIIGVGGGVTINTSTGAIEGGSIGGEALGIGINISKDKGGVGIGISLQIPFTPIELELGLRFPIEKTPTPTPSPTPTPTQPTIYPPPEPSIKTSFNVGDCFYVENHYWGNTFYNYQLGEDFNYITPNPAENGDWSRVIQVTANHRFEANPKFTSVTYYAGSNTHTNATRVYGDPTVLETYSSVNQKSYYVVLGTYFINNRPYIQIYVNYYYVKINNVWLWRSTTTYGPKQCNCQNQLPTSPSPPFPNPPPRKNNMDECCRDSVKLLRELRVYHRESLRLLGRPLSENGLGPIPTKGFFPEETKRVKTPINPNNPNEEIKVKFTDYYQLAQYFLDQLIQEDVANDPRSFKRPEGFIQNPEYNRDSENSLKDNAQPDNDKAGKKRLLKINDKQGIYILSGAQQQQYIFEALKRFDYLFPLGELSDALIAKDLLIPGAKGDIKIHNMIMAYEIQMQYINAALGDPRQILSIKDANPTIEGDQPIEVRALTLSDWMRQIVKFQIDTGGDVDAAVNLMLRDFRTNMANRTDIVKIGEIAQALFEDTGMREQQNYIPLHLEGDPYAGQWVKGEGFQTNPDLEKRTEEATEKVLRETMKPTQIKIKVSRRHKEEKTDMRDLLRGLADFIQRLLSVPTGGDAAKSIEKLIESAKFKIQTDAALLRQNISQAASASRNRTKKRKK